MGISKRHPQGKKNEKYRIIGEKGKSLPKFGIEKSKKSRSKLLMDEL